MSVNSAHFTGHLGNDAELKYLEDGTPLCDFSVAVNEKRREEEIVMWVRCSLFGERAEKLATYLVKGKLVYVRGRIRERTWDDDQGVTHTRWGLAVDDVQLLGGGDGDHSGGDRPPQQQRPQNQQQQRPANNRGGYQRQGGNRNYQNNRGGRR